MTQSIYVSQDVDQLMQSDSKSGMQEYLEIPNQIVNSVNTETGVVIIDADDIDDATTDNKFVTQEYLDKLDTIESGAQVNYEQVLAGEITAGTETGLRSYAPSDIKSFIDTHSSGVAGGSGISQSVFDNHTGNVNNPHETTLEHVRSQDNSISGDIDFNGHNATGIQDIYFANGGHVSWNEEDYTIDLNTTTGSVIQVGQELIALTYNNTETTINNGAIVRVVGAYNGRPSVNPAIANTHETTNSDLMVATSDIPVSGYGFCTQKGKVRDINTSGYTEGSKVYLSATNSGQITSTAPVFPDYPIGIGTVVVEDAISGSIFVDIQSATTNTLLNFWNGTFRENFDFRITSDGAAITGSLTASNGDEYLTMNFDGKNYSLSTSPAATIALTPGTDTIPQTNYVYIPSSTKTLTVSSSGWPTTQHIKVALVELQTASTVKTQGALKNQNINDEIAYTSTAQGHVTHLGERIRLENAKWYSGTEVTATVADAGANVYVSNTAGSVYQMHKQTFPPHNSTPYTIDAVDQGSKTFTISDDGDLSSIFPDGKYITVRGSTGNDSVYTVDSTSYSSPNFVITVTESIPSATADGTIGDPIIVVNDFSTPYTKINSLTEITTTANNEPLETSSFSIVIWGIMNKSGEVSHLMANYPVGTYSKNFPNDAVNDALNYSVYTIPSKYRGVGFLMARLTFVDNLGVWSLYDTEDLRGKVPNLTAGGGAGGSGITSLLGLTDTPSSFTNQSGKALVVNDAEESMEFVDFYNQRDNLFSIVSSGDVSKKIQFEAGEITSGNSRTITMPDEDIDLGQLANSGQKGWMTAEYALKLDGIESGAQVNPTDSEIVTSFTNETPQISDGEKIAGTGEEIRQFAPLDISYMVTGHESVRSVAGKTGDVVISGADVGLENVDNTSDLDKPISTATQAALDTKSTTGHVHGWSEITGKPSEFTPSSHAESHVSGSDLIQTATPSQVGLMSSEYATKIEGIESGAQVNPSDSEISIAYGNEVSQVSSAEIISGSETGLRTYSPLDIKTFVDEHAATGAGGGSGIGSIVEDTSPQLGGDLDAQNYSISNLQDLEIQGQVYASQEFDNGTIVESGTIDFRSGLFQSAHVTGDAIFGLVPTSGPASVLIKLTHDVSGEKTFTWPEMMGGDPFTPFDGVSLIPLYWDGSGWYNSTATSTLYNYTTGIELRAFAVSDETTEIEAEDLTEFRWPFDCTVTRIYASLNVPATGSAFQFGIEKSGVSILNDSSSVSIAASEYTTETAETGAFANASDDYTFYKNEQCLIKSSQVGSTYGGAGAKIHFEGYKI